MLPVELGRGSLYYRDYGNGGPHFTGKMKTGVAILGGPHFAPDQFLAF